MKLSSLLECLWAATQTHRVDSRFRSRGGIILVAPPGHLKTSILRSLENQTGVSGYSDMVTNDLAEARDLISSNKIHTLMLYDLQKLYERRSETVANVIGNIRAIADEGFTTTTIERGSAGGRAPNQKRARALILAATPPKHYRANLGEWRDTGFARRFLFSVYQLKHPEVITSAILADAPIQFMTRALQIPSNLEMPMAVLTKKEEAFLVSFLKYQDCDEVGLVLLKKMLTVLRWKYKYLVKEKDRTEEVMLDFRESLGPEGGELIFDD